MLETQRNEYAMGLLEVANQAEALLHEPAEEHSEEIQRLRQRAEAYVGYQNEDISRLRQELANANAEIQNNTMGRAQTVLHEREIAHMNEVLSNELLMSKANSQHHEAEVSLMQNALRDRSAIFNSEVANLQSAIQNQRELQVQKSGFTEEEIKSFLVRKLAMYCAEFQQESMTLQSMIQSEGDIAKLYKGRYEDIAQSAVGTDSNSEIIMKALKSRLDYEADNTDFHRVKRDEAVQEMRDMRTEFTVKEYEYEAEKGDKVLTRFGNGSKKKRKEGNITIGSGRNPNPNWMKRIKGLNSSNPTLIGLGMIRMSKRHVVSNSMKNYGKTKNMDIVK